MKSHSTEEGERGYKKTKATPQETVTVRTMEIPDDDDDDDNNIGPKQRAP